MKDRQPPSDDQIKEYVKLVLKNADLEKITMREVCSEVMSHYSDFDLAHKRDFIKASVKSILNAKTATAQEETMVKTEEDSEIAAGRNGAKETNQKWEAVENELNLLEEVASRAPQSWAGNGSHSRAQQQRLEEERMSLERPKIEETPADSPSTVETQDASEQADAIEEDVDAESVGDGSESEEVGCSSIYCVHRDPGTAGGRTPRRSQRLKSRAMKPSKLRPLTVLQRMIRLEERHLSLTRDNAIALNHVADSVDRLANFITECSRRIAGDIERRNTPN